MHTFLKTNLALILINLALCLICCWMFSLIDSLLVKNREEHAYDINMETFRAGEYMKADWMQPLLSDIIYFPVAYSVTNKDASVSFENSWMFERTFGGKRGHEGCDVMADINQRGIYPIISMTGGVVEKLGWLPQGGNRIGIRSENGGYFYYAHLYNYAEELQVGDSVLAGEFLGFMGDSGYGVSEGTVGNFAVHLHIGIYVPDENGEDISINPYPILQEHQEDILEYVY